VGVFISRTVGRSSGRAISNSDSHDTTHPLIIHQHSLLVQVPTLPVPQWTPAPTSVANGLNSFDSTLRMVHLVPLWLFKYACVRCIIVYLHSEYLWLFDRGTSIRCNSRRVVQHGPGRRGIKQVVNLLAEPQVPWPYTPQCL
jgi:hypothetical protein